MQQIDLFDLGLQMTETRGVLSHDAKGFETSNYWS